MSSTLSELAPEQLGIGGFWLHQRFIGRIMELFMAARVGVSLIDKK